MPTHEPLTGEALERRIEELFAGMRDTPWHLCPMTGLEHCTERSCELHRGKS